MAVELVERNPVFSGSTWSGEEEEKMLDFIEDRGYGNWAAVGQLMGKSPEECRQHYEQFYIREPHPLMPSLLLPKCCLKKRTFPAYNESLVWDGMPNTKDRPHPISFGIDGYSPFRGDFDKEWCDDAEQMVANTSGSVEGNGCDEDRTITDLKLAVIDRYRYVLNQRLCRKRLIRDYGVLAVNKAGSDDTLVLEKWAISHKMSRFMRLLPPREYDLLLQGLYLQFEVGVCVRRYQDYRRNGIKKKYAAAVYDRISRELKKEQEASNKLYTAKMNVHAKGRIRPSGTVFISGSDRPGSADYSKDPGYICLDHDEKEFCSTHHLPPSQFTKHKKTLLEEGSKKSGTLFLHEARKLLRIDVNKTRKIYDFLISKQLIKNGTIV